MGTLAWSKLIRYAPWQACPNLASGVSLRDEALPSADVPAPSSPAADAEQPDDAADDASVCSVDDVGTESLDSDFGYDAVE